MEELRDSGRYLLGKKNLIVVEIGVNIGTNAVTLLNNLDIAMLHLVDPFLEYSDTGNPEELSMSQDQLDADYLTLQKNMIPYAGKVNIVKDSSAEAAEMYPDGFFDYAYADACHASISVAADIAAWWPKVKSGGVLAGHDFYSYSGVKEAVENFIAQTGLELLGEGVDWYVVKP